MAGTTSPLAFPYPTGTDRVADGDNAMQALAEKIDDYLAGAEAGATYQPNVTAHLEGTGVLRRGGLVVMRVGFRSISGATIAQGTKIFAIPAGFLPDNHVRFLVKSVYTSGQESHSLTLYASGDCFTEQAIPVAAQYAGIVTYALVRP